MALNSIKFILKEFFCMIFVGIDVAKNKHDCFIINSDGEILSDVFTIENNKGLFQNRKKGGCRSGRADKNNRQWQRNKGRCYK